MFYVKNVYQTKKWRTLLCSSIISSSGFTLIELLVVTIMISILVTIAIPNFINQIGKARETDAKNNLGAIARSQQAYHFERQAFANQMVLLTLQGSFGSNYYNFPDPNLATESVAKHQAESVNSATYQIRDYAVGIHHNSGLFQVEFCQAKEVGEIVDVSSTFGGNCTNNGIKIK